jgi:hypothetical protein
MQVLSRNKGGKIMKAINKYTAIAMVKIAFMRVLGKTK